jgi:hypothetical protein
LVHPEELGKSFDMLAEGVRVRAGVDISADSVQGAVDRAKIGKVGIGVFSFDEPPDIVFCTFSHGFGAEEGEPDVD